MRTTLRGLRVVVGVGSQTAIARQHSASRGRKGGGSGSRSASIDDRGKSSISSGASSSVSRFDSGNDISHVTSDSRDGTKGIGMDGVHSCGSSEKTPRAEMGHGAGKGGSTALISMRSESGGRVDSPEPSRTNRDGGRSSSADSGSRYRGRATSRNGSDAQRHHGADAEKMLSSQVFSKFHAGALAAKQYMTRHKSVGSAVTAATSAKKSVPVGLAAGTITASHEYTTFQTIFNFYIERGFVDPEVLVYHPEAPHPARLLLDVMQHRTPCFVLTRYALLACLQPYTRPAAGGSNSGAVAFALEQFAHTIRARCPSLYAQSSIQGLLCQVLLQERLFDAATVVLGDIRDDEELTPSLWHALITAASEGKLPNSMVLWRLLSVSHVSWEPIPSAADALAQGAEATANNPQESHSSWAPKGKALPGATPNPVRLGPGIYRRITGTLDGSVRSVDVTNHSVEWSTRRATVSTANVSPRSSFRHPNTPVGTDSEVTEMSSARRGDALNNVVIVARPFDVRAASTVLFKDITTTPRSEKDLAVSSTTSSDSSRGATPTQVTKKKRMQTAYCFHTLPVSEIGYSLNHYTRTLQDDREWFSGITISQTATHPDKLLELLQKQEQMGRNGTLDLATCGVVYGVDAALASKLMLRANTSFAGQASPLLAQHILRRYIQTHTLSRACYEAVRKRRGLLGGDGREQKSVADAEALADADAIHPSPFLVFFKLMREVRDVVSSGSELGTGGLPMVHWQLVWNYFQLLNRENPRWFTVIPEEAEDLCMYAIEVLCRGANPWLTLNVARAVSARHITDGVEMSIWLLHRLDSTHHREEAREVTIKIFRWLLVDVGIHLQQHLRHNIIPAARVLIRLGLQEELKQLYNAVLGHVYTFNQAFRDEFVQVMSDLVCPSCSSILQSGDVHAERMCSMCMTVVPAKASDAEPSFNLSSEHIAHLRERHRQQSRLARQRIERSIARITGKWPGRTNRDGDTGDAAESGSGSANGAVGEGGDVASEQRRWRQPPDAAVLFEKKVLQNIKPLLPGVSVEGVSLFDPVSSLDLRSAMEESSRRLQLQDEARRYALSQRGVSLERLKAALPSSLSLAGGSAALMGHAVGMAAASAQALLRVDSLWTCVWCQEVNTEWSSRSHCSACGAETGPVAPWRAFAYAADGNVMTEVRARISNCEDRPEDAVVAAYLLMVYRRTFLLRALPYDHELIDQLIRRLTVQHERILAGYLYMRLVPPQLRKKGETVAMLAQLFSSVDACAELSESDMLSNEDKVFACVFSPVTCKVCFGTHSWQSCPIITRDFSHTTSPGINLSVEEKQWVILEHLKRSVDAATRRSASSPSPPSADAAPRISLSSSALTAEEERRRADALVVQAYADFVTSPFRELFAEVYSTETNLLSMVLSAYKQFRRAAFVLCHVPLHLRHNQAYLMMLAYFNAPREEALMLLDKRSPLNVNDETHPNFVQVTVTCCMCLDGQHASFNCPRLQQWLNEVKILEAEATAAAVSAASVFSGQEKGHPHGGVRRDNNTKSNRNSSSGSSSNANPLRSDWRRNDHMSSSALALAPSSSTPMRTPQHIDQVAKRLRAQVDSWTTAGPERLHAFYRFILEHVDIIHRETVRVDPLNSPALYAVNKTISKLATVGRRSYAYRLYARSPVEFVTKNTTAAMLRMNNFSEESVRSLLSTPSSASTACHEATAAAASEVVPISLTEAGRMAALPLRDRCLLCFEEAHTYYDCPELAAQPSNAARLEYVVEQVGGLRATNDGVKAAAAFVYHTYNQGNLTGDMMRSHSSLVRAMLRLVERCFASRAVGQGVRVLRRIPVEMVPLDSAYVALWRAAGLPEETVEERRIQLAALIKAEGITPNCDTPPPRKTYSNGFMSSLSNVLHDDLCRHCYLHGHSLATCSVFHAEVSFGRDFVAAYRMSMMSEQLDRDWQDAYLVKLVDFFLSHRYYVPYHIAGVANALNAIAAMWCFRGEPGIAMRQLLAIPPAYRRRQAFKHVLHACNVPHVELSRLLASVPLSSDVHPSASTSSSMSPTSTGGGGVFAQHLLLPRPAMRDVAMDEVFSRVPVSLEALEMSAERMQVIRRRNATQHVRTDAKPVASKESDKGGISQLSDAKSALVVSHTARKDALGMARGAAAGTGSSFAPCVQSCDIAALREDFDPILSELEDAVGMKLGSRHILFAGAVDILAPEHVVLAQNEATRRDIGQHPHKQKPQPQSQKHQQKQRESEGDAATRTTRGSQVRGPRWSRGEDVAVAEQVVEVVSRDHETNSMIRSFPQGQHDDTRILNRASSSSSSSSSTTATANSGRTAQGASQRPGSSHRQHYNPRRRQFEKERLSSSSVSGGMPRNNANTSTGSNGRVERREKMGKKEWQQQQSQSHDQQQRRPYHPRR